MSLSVDLLIHSINAVKTHPVQRATALREFSRKARIQVEQARQNEKVRIDLTLFVFVRTSPQYCSRQRQMLRFLSNDIKNYCVSYDWLGPPSYRSTQDDVGNQCFCISPQYIHRWPLVMIHVPGNGTGITPTGTRRDGGESVYKYCSELGDDVLAQNRIFLYVLKATVIRDPLDGDGDIRT